VIYIREAHPGEARNKFNIPQPKAMEERQKVARDFVQALKLSVPVLVDTMDDLVGKAYSGWPDRLYVIGADGKVALKGGPGPGGFSPAVKAAPAVLDRLLAVQK
jgi:type I thyroxine 5'-deiodinase